VKKSSASSDNLNSSENNEINDTKENSNSKPQPQAQPESRKSAPGPKRKKTASVVENSSSEAAVDLIGPPSGADEDPSDAGENHAEILIVEEAAESQGPPQPGMTTEVPGTTDAIGIPSMNSFADNFTKTLTEHATGIHRAYTEEEINMLVGHKDSTFTNLDEVQDIDKEVNLNYERSNTQHCDQNPENQNELNEEELEGNLDSLPLNHASDDPGLRVSGDPRADIAADVVTGSVQLGVKKSDTLGNGGGNRKSRASGASSVAHLPTTKSLIEQSNSQVLDSAGEPGGGTNSSTSNQNFLHNNSSERDVLVQSCEKSSLEDVPPPQDYVLPSEDDVSSEKVVEKGGEHNKTVPPSLGKKKTSQGNTTNFKSNNSFSDSQPQMLGSTDSIGVDLGIREKPTTNSKSAKKVNSKKVNSDTVRNVTTKKSKHHRLSTDDDSYSSHSAPSESNSASVNDSDKNNSSSNSGNGTGSSSGSSTGTKIQKIFTGEYSNIKSVNKNRSSSNALEAAPPTIKDPKQDKRDQERIIDSFLDEFCPDDLQNSYKKQDTTVPVSSLARRIESRFLDQRERERRKALARHEKRLKGGTNKALGKDEMGNALRFQEVLLTSYVDELEGMLGLLIDKKKYSAEVRGKMSNQNLNADHTLSGAVEHEVTDSGPNNNPVDLSDKLKRFQRCVDDIEDEFLGHCRLARDNNSVVNTVNVEDNDLNDNMVQNRELEAEHKVEDSESDDEEISEEKSPGGQAHIGASASGAVPAPNIGSEEGGPGPSHSPDEEEGGEHIFADDSSPS